MASSPEDFRRLEKAIPVGRYIVKDIFVTTVNPRDLIPAYPEAYTNLHEAYRNKRLITFYVEDDILYGMHYLGQRCYWDKRVGGWFPV
jgi:hypothetical protein